MSRKSFHQFHTAVHETCVQSGLIEIGPFTSIEDSVLLDARDFGRISIGMRSKVKRGVTIRAFDGNVVIGNRVSIGENCVAYGHGGLVIGDGTMIAPLCVLAASEHIFEEDDVPIRFQGELARGISIGRGAWVGARAVILDGVSIGEGAVIGAGAVVTEDVPEYSVSVGMPCRPLRRRLTETIARVGREDQG